MAELLEMIDRLGRLVERLDTEWGRLDQELSSLQGALDRLPHGIGGVVHLPSPHRLTETSAALGGMPADIATLAPACIAAQGLTEAAAEWRRIASTVAPAITESFDTVAMAKDKRGWQSLAAEQYDHFVTKYNGIAEDLDTLLREAATAMEQADEMINGWLGKALAWALGLATLLLGTILSLIRLAASLTDWTVALFDTLALFGGAAVVAEEAFVTASIALDTAAAPLAWAVVAALAAAITLTLAVQKFQSDLEQLGEDAARPILDVYRRLHDSTPWPVEGNVPSQDSWATP